MKWNNYDTVHIKGYNLPAWHIHSECLHGF